MFLRPALTVALAIASLAPAHAAAPAIDRNARIYSADGTVLGKVDRLLMKGDELTGVQLIFGSKMIVIPADTLTVEESGVKTSLTKKEVRALR
ncbi:hypothetical protein SAMN05518849_103254 [Sphingobium sp. AP50]|uniref:hypothetical protein n=1 Tax=Sphingobium sp. AP50 TaxID=1884369 RepID=UPI0008C63199|nr:hypothetical protein [Sphingobium sp. AP50]SEJ17785.1 hypothetical protein SAMN05518849_103254 [Sphingobium sp. AP50]